MLPRFSLHGLSFPFIEKSTSFIALSGILILGSIISFLMFGLNLGIDFKGGTLIEVRVHQGVTLTDMREKLSQLKLGDFSIQEFGQPDDLLIRVQNQDGGELAQQKLLTKIKSALQTDVSSYRRVEVVGPTVGHELQASGIKAVVMALFFLMIYIWFRFEWQFSISAMIALVHDIITTIGFFALTGLEFNLATVAAVLTICGYSINDTVVVFDRVRENLRRYRKKDMKELLNMSINETLSRTLITSFTTLLALLALVVFGGEVIRGFSIALIWGVLVGTYSSICVAVPLLSHFNLRVGTLFEESEE